MHTPRHFPAGPGGDGLPPCNLPRSLVAPLKHCAMREWAFYKTCPDKAGISGGYAIPCWGPNSSFTAPPQATAALRLRMTLQKTTTTTSSSRPGVEVLAELWLHIANAPHCPFWLQELHFGHAASLDLITRDRGIDHERRQKRRHLCFSRF